MRSNRCTQRPVWICAPWRSAACGQAVRKAAHVHLAAALVEHAAMETLAGHLGTHARRVEDLDVGIDVVAHQPLGAALQRLKMRRPRGEFELAGAHEVAVDAFVAHQAFDGVHGLVVSVVPLARPFDADLRGHVCVVDGQAVVDVATIAARGLAGHAFARLEHRHFGTATGQRPRRRQSREARRRRSPHQPARAVRALPAESSERCRSSRTRASSDAIRLRVDEPVQRPTTPARPPMSLIST